jgi:hypothetical protein
MTLVMLELDDAALDEPDEPPQPARTSAMATASTVITNVFLMTYLPVL